MTVLPLKPNLPDDTNSLEILHSISDILSSSLNLNDTLSSIFSILNRNIRLGYGVLTLKDTLTDRLLTEMVYGLDGAPYVDTILNTIQDIAAKVFDTQHSYLIDTVEPSHGPLYLAIEDNPNHQEEYFFVCVPVISGDEKIGTLSAWCLKSADQDPTDTAQLFTLLAVMISQEVRVTRLIDIEREELRSENLLLKDELKQKYKLDNMIGRSSAMQTVYESILQVADSNATVLVRGESGTGKELVAHAIHYNSPRSQKPFIKINCSAIPESLIESTLFGYEKGAFTDAQNTKIGKFEAAHKGTIFLDEIGELSPSIQAKLLRVLQEKEFSRVGGVTPIKVDVRVITATNRDLEKELQENRFRQDLYYRLNVFPIFIPPLRDRKTDILLLAEYFLQKFSKENSKKINRISSFAIDLLNSYHWPGNVRELENCMERAVLVCKNDAIQATNLPPTLQRIDTTSTEGSEQLSFEEAVCNFERELIIDALKKSKGNKTKAAAYLRTTPRIIGYKADQLNIDISLFKKSSQAG